MSFAAGVYAGIRTGGGGGGGGGDGQRRLFGLKKIDKESGGAGSAGARDGKDGTGAQGAGAPTSVAVGAAGSAVGSTVGGVAGCVSGSRRACAALMFHALASVPLSRNKQEEDEFDAKIEG